MKVKVWDDVFAYIPLSGKSKVAHLRLHEDLGIFLAVDDIRVYAFQDLNCFGDAVLELFECFFVVFEDGDVLGTEACCDEFGCVGAGLNLIGKTARC